MKGLSFVAIFALCFLALTGPAASWEFEMTGEYEWRFRYLGRTGDADLFGNMRVQDASLPFAGPGASPMIGFAGPNLYGRGQVASTAADFGGQVTVSRGGFSESGSDAHYRDQRITLSPHISVNKAIHFHSVFTIGGYRNKYDRSTTGVGIPPYERYYMERVSRNATDTAGSFSLEKWKAIVRVPWGIFSLGIKDFPIGTGATLAENTRASALVVVIPYGPFSAIPAVWLGRTRFNDGWNTSPDGAEQADYFGSLGLIYKAGPLDMGWLGLWRFFHSNAYEAGGIAFDDYTEINLIYAKYYNGRVFANGEFALLNTDRKFLGALPSYSHCRHFFVEAGVLAGPARISLMGAGTTGFALNNNNATLTCMPMAINYQVMEPYEWLMFNTFGGGNNGGWRPTTVPLTSDDHGQMADSFGFGARVDYAVAANLNIWGSYLWAHRTELNGHYAGGTSSTGADAYAGLTHAEAVAAAQDWKTLNGFGPDPNPYVDDGFIGYEIGAGVNWKLLESMTVQFRYAYWQPGAWFDQAYQVVGIRGGQVVTDSFLKGRDAVQALEGKMLVQF